MVCIERTGCIYKITNLKNGKVYIGQTVQSPPIKRWIDHYKTAKSNTNPNKLYEDICKQGIVDFSFQIIKENIPAKNLYEEEIYYIDKYNSTDESKGYNVSKGGYLSVSSKITKSKARIIAQEIIDKPEYTMADIARLYDINVEMISDINNGDTWKFDDFTYPIRDNSKMKNILSKEQVFEIYELLKQGESATNIAEKYGVSTTNITNINQGKVHRYLSVDEYPITTFYNSGNNLSIKQVAQIIYLLVTNKEKTYRELAEEYNMPSRRKTFGYINQGSVYEDMSKGLGIVKFPIKENYSQDDEVIKSIKERYIEVI